MKKNLLFAFALLFCGYSAFAQYPPTSFSYEKYLSGAEDQLVQNPCYVHATIAGIEAMYNLYYGKVVNGKFFGCAPDLSERALFAVLHNNGGASQTLSQVTAYVSQSGAILESYNVSGTTYPSLNTSCENMPQSEYFRLWDSISKNFDWNKKQEAVGARFKIDAMAIGMEDDISIKRNLMSCGPIIFEYKGSTTHAMLLIGWDEQGWIVKDSWPCKAGIGKILYGKAYNNIPGSFTTFNNAYIIKGITKEVYNKNTRTWKVENPPAKNYQNFGLGFLKIVKKTTPSPLCYNRGIQYELQGLNYLTGAVCTGWTYEASANYNKEISLTVNGNTCTVAGNGAGVVLYATIQRSTGIMERISLNIGNVGIPVNLSNYNGHCAGTNYEVTSQMSVLTLPNTTYNITFSIPSSPDGSYYVTTGGSNAWWVFKTPGGVQYSSTATATKTGCPSISNTKYSIVYGSFCGGYSYYYKSAVDSASNKLIEEDFGENPNLVTPNPVRTDLTLTHVGEGTNDIRIYDLSGNLVYSIMTEETVTIDVSMIPRGVYIVKYFADKSVAPIKIILE